MFVRKLRVIGSTGKCPACMSGAGEIMYRLAMVWPRSYFSEPTPSAHQLPAPFTNQFRRTRKGDQKHAYKSYVNASGFKIDN